MDAFGQKKHIRKRDRLQRWLSGLTILCWIVFLVALIVFHYARPQIDYGFLKYKDVVVREHWDAKYLPWYLTLLWGCMVITLIDLIARLVRRYRHKHHHYYNLIVLLLIVIACLESYYVGLFR
ncbi:MAG: hypothetical protein CENE_00242 [Candidatus Celerinatantimonas neptuna]|nr:MAG: hypothetical protein CENE_00242 [Candidatus Celerinatantimonas neptuna]